MTFFVAEQINGQQHPIEWNGVVEGKPKKRKNQFESNMKIEVCPIF